MIVSVSLSLWENTLSSQISSFAFNYWKISSKVEFVYFPNEWSHLSSKGGDLRLTMTQNPR